MSRALEERVLEALASSRMTYDQLRATLGAVPGELDSALSTLDRARQIKRANGRIELLNGAAAAAEDPRMSTTRKCSVCGIQKPFEDFPKKGAQCKPCQAAKAKAAYQAKQKRKGLKPARAAAEAPAARRHMPGTFNGSGVMFLAFHDGARIGPITTTAAGVAHMACHVDLSREQLDELVTWWQTAKAA